MLPEQAPRRLVDDLLDDGAGAERREALRSACQARLHLGGVAHRDLLEDVLADGRQASLKATLAGARAGATRRRSRLGAAAAILTVLLVGARLWRRSPGGPDAHPAAAPPHAAPAWLVRTRTTLPAIAPASLVAIVRTAPRSAWAAEPGAALQIATRPHAPWRPAVPRSVERLGDDELLALLRGHPVALVDAAEGGKRLLLLDPGDELRLFDGRGGPK